MNASQQAALQMQQAAEEGTLMAKHTKPRGEDAPAGMYLFAYHGRSDPEQELSSWGFDGPTIGPLKEFCVTYLASVTLMFADDTEINGGPGSVIRFEQDMLYVSGSWYGDWETFYHAGGPL